MPKKRNADVALLIAVARRRAALSKRELARRAGTSAASIAGYESGRKEPRVSTLARILSAAGTRLVVTGIPNDMDLAQHLDDRQRLNLELHKVVARELLADPDTVLAKARRNLERLQRRSNDVEKIRLLDYWEWLLDAPIGMITALLESPTQRAAEMRAVAPFQLVVPALEKWRICTDFGKSRT